MDFIRRYYWYKGKTNYRPPVVNVEYGNFDGVKLPLISKPFKSIDTKEFVSVQPMKLGG